MADTTVTNSTITGAGLQRSSSMTMPGSAEQIWTDVVDSTGQIYGNRILVDVYLTPSGVAAFDGLWPFFVLG